MIPVISMFYNKDMVSTIVVRVEHGQLTCHTIFLYRQCDEKKEEIEKDKVYSVVYVSEQTKGYLRL